MTEKSKKQRPISCKLGQVCAALDPVKMALLECESEQSLFDKILDTTYSKKRITAKQGGSAKEQFDNFLQKVARWSKTKFPNFNQKITRIDEFLGF